MSFYSAIATGVIGVYLVHSILPQHWLPFIVVGKKHKWPQSKILLTLFFGAVAHAFSTVTVGVLVGYLGHQIDQRFEVLHGIVPGLALFAFGSGFLVSGFHHEHKNLYKNRSIWSLLLVVSISPCLVVAPFFMMLSTASLETIIYLCLTMAAVSVTSMGVLGYLVLKGMSTLKFKWLEEKESQIMGGILIIMGLLFIIL